MSSDVVIRIEKLGKQYRYGGAAPLTYNLRADITDWIKGMLPNWSGRQPCAATPDGNAEHEIGHVTLSEVHKRRIAESPDYFWALKDINLEVRQGEVVGVIGRNGAGKSTLLKILSRITLPTTGKVTYHGRIASLLEVGTGFHRELTGRENIYLNGSILGMKRVEIAKNFDEIVDFSGVEKFIDTPVKFYSSGMYVRLAFAIAAQLESDILIVDEVLAVGDATFQKKCLNKMDEVSRAGRAVMFVSHNMSAVKTLCPRVVLVHDGIVQLDGEADKVVSCYLSEEASGVYLGKGSKSDVPYVERIAFSDVDGVEKEIFCNGETLVVKTEIHNPNGKQLEVEFAFFDNAGCKLWNFTHALHNLPPVTGCPKAKVDVAFFVPKINAREIFVHVGLHIVGYHVTHYVDHITHGLRYFIKDSASGAFQHNDSIMPCPVEVRVHSANS